MHMMKKGFTLIELLIVVVVLVTLMTMVFRLGNIGDESERRSVTIQRMQRLENALSGYYAAFGMYPPVSVHGSRNIFLKVDEKGMQSDSGEENESIWGWLSSDGASVQNWTAENRAWAQVKAACMSQPVSCEFPFDKSYRDLVMAASEALRSAASSAEGLTPEQQATCAAGFDDGVSENIGRHSKNKGKIHWSEVQLFKFGALSYLLPRYLVMMNIDEETSNDIDLWDFAQWKGNNSNPSDAWTGQKMPWKKVQEYVLSDRNSDMMRVANIPSQAVCARWMASFEKTLACNMQRTLFGVDIRGDDADSIPRWIDNGSGGGYIRGAIYNPDGYKGSPANNYILDCITIRDGWGNDFYYYSPAPYQSYVVWSSGANGRTFAPWVAREKLSGDANRCISYWTKDDIVGQSN